MLKHYTKLKNDELAGLLFVYKIKLRRFKAIDEYTFGEWAYEEAQRWIKGTQKVIEYFEKEILKRNCIFKQFERRKGLNKTHFNIDDFDRYCKVLENVTFELDEKGENYYNEKKNEKL